MQEFICLRVIGSENPGCAGLVCHHFVYMFNAVQLCASVYTLYVCVYNNSSNT